MVRFHRCDKAVRAPRQGFGVARLVGIVSERFADAGRLLTVKP